MPKAKKSDAEKPAKAKDVKPKADKPAKEKKTLKKEKVIAAAPVVVVEEKPAKVGRKPAAAKALAAKLGKAEAATPVVADPAPLKPAKVTPAVKAAPEPEVVITNEDIALRAYFIAERRQAMGWPGDSTSDWVEAERQLRAEAKRKAKK